MTDQIITRFAPSPTGFLHIGGARTALFNWLYSKHKNGKMLLRIEDTDRERSSEQATSSILEGLSWLGICWDGDPVSQYARLERHREVAYELLRLGKAYYCYTTPKELEEMREKAREQGQPPRYDRRWREAEKLGISPPAGIKPALRIKAPLSGETILQDRVQGKITFPNKDLDDFIILRSDGTPTYMHAGVVDDHDMGVTHIIRGDDHLTNAVRQIVIYNAMDWNLPVMAHIPLIHGADGAKLSKRHGALGVESYREMGYLPEAILNYLARLGWSHGNDEIMSIAEMIEWFDIDDINKSASRFDLAKLKALNAVHMRRMTDTELFTVLKKNRAFFPKIESCSTELDPQKEQKLFAAIPHAKERSRTLHELLENSAWSFSERPIILDDAAHAILTPSAQDILQDAYDFLLQTDKTWNTQTIEQAVRACVEKRGIKLSELAQPLRAALTGKSTSPGLFDVLAVLGAEESLARIKDQISFLPNDA